MALSKRPNGCRSNSRDQRPVPRETSPLKKLDQKMWRRDCLRSRIKENKMTDKNKIEAKNLGLPGTEIE